MNREPAPIPDAAPALTHNPSYRSLSLRNMPVPAATSSEDHIIRVHAVAITNGELTWPEPLTAKPFPIPGYEVSGTVVSAPGPDSPFQPGTEIYARTDFERAGNAREYTVIPTGEMGRKPRNLS